MKYQAVKTLLAGLVFLGVGTIQSSASTFTYYFSGVVTAADIGQSCSVVFCDPLLVGTGAAAIGTSFTGQYTFDDAWTPIVVGPGQTDYETPAADLASYPSSVNLGGVNFSFSGVHLGVAPESHYEASSLAAYSEINAYAGSQLLAHGYWALILANTGTWGNGTFSIPSSPPLLANFDNVGNPGSIPYFDLTVWSNYDEPGNAIGYQYTGTITCLNDTGLSDCPASDVSNVPLPAALPLFAAGLAAMGLMGWCKRRKAVLAA